jgi:hypothetical protein
MPRAPRKRRPTEADLSDSQRRIYDTLPHDLKNLYLRDLPAVSVSNAGNRKKAQLIRDRVALLDNVLVQLQEQRRELNQLAKSLDLGKTSATNVDLRTLLKPPAIGGVSMRYVRKREE